MALGSGRVIALAVVLIVLFSGCLLYRELNFVPSSRRRHTYGIATRLSGIQKARGDYGPDVIISPVALLPNEGREGVSGTEIGNEVGTRSIYNGLHQEERQRWLRARAEELREDVSRRTRSKENSGMSKNAGNRRDRRRLSDDTSAQDKTGLAWDGIGSGLDDGQILRSRAAHGPDGGATSFPPQDTVEDGDLNVFTTPGRREQLPRSLKIGQRVGVPPWVQEGQGVDDTQGVSLEERLHRLDRGVELWDATYVPPIAPDEKQRLLKKWTAPAYGVVGEGAAAAAAAAMASATPIVAVGAPRVLMVVTSFDRGKRLGAGFRGSVDKLDFILMMMDEIREACEAGFSPRAHLIAAWDARPEEEVIVDRLYCKRTGSLVPYTFKEYSPKLKEVLSIKHRLYMKPRVEDHDLFIQAEDDMIFTVNHMLRYLEESEKLTGRKGKKADYSYMPGFIRVEPAPVLKQKMNNGNEEVREQQGAGGGEWFQWEIILSRIRGAQIKGAGTYLTLDYSRVLPLSGNNQGLWVATQAQLKYLHAKCGYLRYDEKSAVPHVEKFSGSLEMFSPRCRTTKVFPASRFEDFLVHHRTNNKNGKRGESIPGVSVSFMRLWASQIIRDSGMLPEMGARRSLRR